MTITSGDSGRGSGTIDYLAAPNPGSAQRTGTLTVAGVTHTLMQQGAVQQETVQGPVSRISGTCPNLTFFVRNVAVATNAATRWMAGTCTALRNNSQVAVEGRQSDGTLLATSVEITK
jgi:hypothetical protein